MSIFSYEKNAQLFLELLFEDWTSPQNTESRQIHMVWSQRNYTTNRRERTNKKKGVCKSKHPCV